MKVSIVPYPYQYLVLAVFWSLVIRIDVYWYLFIFYLELDITFKKLGK